MRIFISVIILALSVGTSNAYVSNEGHEYESWCNENGMVLTSVGPVTRYIEAGSNSTFAKGKEVIYLGAQCDVYNEVLGEGEWGWANGGFWLNFNHKEISFPRQEVYCKEEQSYPEFSGNCRK